MRAAVLRAEQQTRFIVCERRRSRRILDIRAADLQEELAEQRFPFRQLRRRRRGNSSEGRSERSEQSYSAMREQLKIWTYCSCGA